MNLVCPDCLKPIEIIKACGCRDYFCNHCNQLVSKSRALDIDELSNYQEKEVDDKSTESAA
ncbi:zinc-ribbon domain-containing protein [Reinekea sp. G2M2-21]|uniref:YfgJ family double zinc ribbon protein n=1 Tax=Reinekea sp. G2M2-21 TaxID=2788942 RepID=UPI0018A9E8AA|nr:zinc-ribbon domain-containing protein [Reinekea sp. G2M2-21]